MSVIPQEILFVNPLYRNPKVHVTSAGVLFPDSSYYHKKSCLPCTLFEYIVAGKGHIQYNGRHYMLSQGDLCIIKQGLQVVYFADSRDPYEKIWFGAKGDVVEKLMEAYEVDDDIFIARTDVRSDFDSLIESLRAKRYDDRLAAQSVMSILLKTSQTLDMGQDASLIARIRQYMDQHVLEKPSLDEIASKFSISKRHLIRLFKDRFACTPMTYINRKKLMVAAHYLVDTEYSVGVIAQKLHYCDQSYFSSEFKRHFGVYPTVYRRLNGRIPSSSESTKSACFCSESC